jgi:hypothetical protein
MSCTAISHGRGKDTKNSIFFMHATLVSKKDTQRTMILFFPPYIHSRLFSSKHLPNEKNKNERNNHNRNHYRRVLSYKWIIESHYLPFHARSYSPRKDNAASTREACHIGTCPNFCINSNTPIRKALLYIRVFIQLLYKVLQNKVIFNNSFVYSSISADTRNN